MSGLPHALGLAARPPRAADPAEGFVHGFLGFALEHAYARLAEQRRRTTTPLDVGVPVLSVGNLTVGGTGKTPCTAWLARRLLAAGRRVHVVAGRVGRPVPDGPTDEAALLARLVPGAPIHVAPRKVDAAREAVTAGAEVLVVDDGFSHVALARAFDLVLLDAARPLGNGHLLPYGPLREPPTALARAGALVVTRADRVTEAHRARTRQALAVLAPGIPIAAARLVPDGFRDGATGTPVDAPIGTRAVCVSGLGRPGDLATSVRGLGVEVVDDRAYPDHHRFGRAEWAAALRAAERAHAWLVVSAKDAVRLPAAERARVRVVDVTFEWVDDEAGRAVEARIDAAAGGAR